MDPMNKDYNPDQGLPDPNQQQAKDTGNVIGGLKASLNNDGHSDEAKQADRERLEQMADDGRGGFNTDASAGTGKP